MFKKKKDSIIIPANYFLVFACIFKLSNRGERHYIKKMIIRRIKFVGMSLGHDGFDVGFDFDLDLPTPLWIVEHWKDKPD